MLLIEFSFLIQNQISYVMSEPSEKAIDNLMEKGFKVIFGQRKMAQWMKAPATKPELHGRWRLFPSHVICIHTLYTCNKN